MKDVVVRGLSTAWQRYIADVARQSNGSRMAAADPSEASRRGFAGSLVVAALLRQEWHEHKLSLGPDVGADVHVRTSFHEDALLQIDADGSSASARWVQVQQGADGSYAVAGWCWREEMYGLGKLVHDGEAFVYIEGWAPIYNRRHHDLVVIPRHKLRPAATLLARRPGNVEWAEAFLAREYLPLDPHGRPWALGELAGGERRRHVSKQTDGKRRVDREAKRRQRLRDAARPEELWR